MSRVSAETPSKAQQSCVGTDSTKPCGSGLATAAGGAVRMIGAEGTLAGCTPSFTVAFIGESAIRAVSLRGPAGATPRPASGLAGGKTGFGGAGAAGGFKPEGGGGGTKAFAGGGEGGVGEVAPGGGGTGAFASGGAAGGLGAGGGGGGRLLFDPVAGGGTLGLIPDGGGEVGGLKPGAGGRLLGGRTAPEGAEGAGGGVGRAGWRRPCRGREWLRRDGGRRTDRARGRRAQISPRWFRSGRSRRAVRQIDPSRFFFHRHSRAVCGARGQRDAHCFFLRFVQIGHNKFQLHAPGKTPTCLSNPARGVNHQSPSRDQIVAAYAQNCSPNEFSNRRRFRQNDPRVHLWGVGLGPRDQRLVHQEL